MLLNCHTIYSFCYGTYTLDALMDAVLAAGFKSFVLADINNTSACLDAVRLAPEKGLKPILGIDFRQGANQKFVGIACNNEGFFELNQFLSSHLHAGTKVENIAPDFKQVVVVYPLQKYTGFPLKGNEFIGVSMQEIKRLQLSKYRHLKHKMVVLQTFTYSNKKQFNAHRLLRAIDCNMLLSKLPKSEQSNGFDTLATAYEIYTAFVDWPEIISNTEWILNTCSIHFDYGKLSNKNLKHYTGSAEGDMALLRSECLKGLPYRYPQVDDTVMQRIEKELQVIEQLNFASYFLINWDIINYARHKNFYYVGRGSGANSILAYLLRITDVDPIELDLYFERFINLYRSNAPDFDMDFSWTDRDDITQYMFKRFGYERTALLGAYNTFQDDAVLRELGKVFGLPPDEIDKLQHIKKLEDTDGIGRMVIKYSAFIKGFPSHMSIHSSGIIISEAPIYAYSATNMPPKGFPCTQFSMLEAEDIGLYKFDILSQRGLGKIKDTLGLVKENQNIDIDVHDIKRFKQDENVKDLLRTGNTIACFYVESPAMRMLLTKLKADDYLRLVAASSIIRPGVARSGMMREYIVRFRDPSLREKARAALPELYDLLAETYGVMVYQEDVIKVAHFFAGLSLAEADYLRRGMSWKFKKRDEFSRVKENFIKNCRAKGHSEKVVQDIWMQVESFASFAFSKGHSASYAVESYQALFLKAYYPLEYLTATLNNGGGFYRKDLYLHEARMLGASIKHPCVNRSAVMCRIEGKEIILGLGFIDSLDSQIVLDILLERERNGKFINMNDLIQRVPMGIETLRLLIRANTLSFTSRLKMELLWEAHALLQPSKKPELNRSLFEKVTPQWKMPTLYHSKVDGAFEEIELFGFSFCSAFQLLKEEAPKGVLARELKNYMFKYVLLVAELVTVKYARTVNGERMYFGTFIDEEGNWIDTVHFPPSAAQYPFTGKGVYKLYGRVVEEYDFISIEIQKMRRLPLVDRESLDAMEAAV